MRTFSLLALVIIATLASRAEGVETRPASGAAALKSHRPAASPEEPFRVGTELAAAYVTSSFAVVLGLKLLDTRVSALGWGTFVLVPAIVALPVCAIGAGSEVYEGSCGAAIGGAFAGALVALPLALLGYVVASDDPLGATLGGVIGLIGGSAIGAVVGWNGSRVARASPPVTSLPADGPSEGPASPWLELRRRPEGLEPAGGRRFTLPVLAFRF